MKYVMCDSKLYPFNVRKVGREKKVYYSADGEPFVRVYNRRMYMHDVMRLPYPMMYEDETGKVGAVGGVYSMGYVGYYVELLDGCESVQLWEEC